jgi:predicted HTH transcriptional regulator
LNKPQESFAYNPRQIQELKKLVLQGESQTLEFKRKASYPDKILREMIAFANARGGTLLVGVGDDRSLAGLKHPEGESFVIQQELKKCIPPLIVHESFIPIGDSRTIIQYEIPESKTKPHARIAGTLKESYIRVNDQSIKASREVREIVKRSSRKKDIKFHYGDHEKFLMQYLDEHPSITLKKFVELSGLKKFYASKKLVLLVLADVLRITPHEKGDLFSLAFGNNSKKNIS